MRLLESQFIIHGWAPRLEKFRPAMFQYILCMLPTVHLELRSKKENHVALCGAFAYQALQGIRFLWVRDRIRVAAPARRDDNNMAHNLTHVKTLWKILCNRRIFRNFIRR